MIVTHQVLPGWEQAFLATVVVIGFVLVQFRNLWHIPKYWLLFSLTFIIHGLLMMWLRSFMNEYRLFSTLAIVLIEVFVLFVLFKRLVPVEE